MSGELNRAASQNGVAPREQRLDDPGVLLRHRPHQRRLVAPAFHRVHVSAFGEQLPDDLHIARASGCHQGRLA